MYGICCSCLDKHNDNNKKNRNPGERRISYVKIKGKTTYSCILNVWEKTPSEIKEPNLFLWFTTWILQAFVPAELPCSNSCQAGNSLCTQQGMVAQLNTWAREGLSLISHQSHANMNNFSLILRAEPGFHFETRLLIERVCVGASSEFIHWSKWPRRFLRATSPSVEL